MAVPATVAYNYFVGAIDRFVIEMEEASSGLIEEVGRRNACSAAAACAVG